MPGDFSAEYSERADDELLRLASERDSLTLEAAAALDAELRRRNLSERDQARYQRFLKRSERRDAIRQKVKIWGTWRDRSSWVDVFWAVIVMVVISSIYLALPSRYQMKPDWQEAAVHMMFASVFIAVVGREWWQKLGFWISLVISSAIHLVVVHAWLRHAGRFSRGNGKLAILLGFVLFFAVYGMVWVLRRNFYGEKPAHN